MQVNNSIQIQIHDINITLRELAYEIAMSDNMEYRCEKLSKFVKLERRRNLYLCGEFNGMTGWSWKTAIDKGWVSKADMEMFKDEIEGSI